MFHTTISNRGMISKIEKVLFIVWMFGAGSKNSTVYFSLHYIEMFWNLFQVSDFIYILSIFILIISVDSCS